MPILNLKPEYLTRGRRLRNYSHTCRTMATELAMPIPNKVPQQLAYGSVLHSFLNMTMRQTTGPTSATVA